MCFVYGGSIKDIHKLIVGNLCGHLNHVPKGGFISNEFRENKEI